MDAGVKTKKPGQQLERARQGAVEACAIVRVVRANRALDFTAYVRQLFH